MFVKHHVVCACFYRDLQNIRERGVVRLHAGVTTADFHPDSDRDCMIPALSGIDGSSVGGLWCGNRAEVVEQPET